MLLTSSHSLFARVQSADDSEKMRWLEIMAKFVPENEPKCDKCTHRVPVAVYYSMIVSETVIHPTRAQDCACEPRTYFVASDMLLDLRLRKSLYPTQSLGEYFKALVNKNLTVAPQNAPTTFYFERVSTAAFKKCVTDCTPYRVSIMRQNIQNATAMFNLATVFIPPPINPAPINPAPSGFAASDFVDVDDTLLGLEEEEPISEITVAIENQHLEPGAAVHQVASIIAAPVVNPPNAARQSRRTFFYDYIVQDVNPPPTNTSYKVFVSQFYRDPKADLDFFISIQPIPPAVVTNIEEQVENNWFFLNVALPNLPEDTIKFYEKLLKNERNSLLRENEILTRDKHWVSNANHNKGYPHWRRDDQNLTSTPGDEKFPLPAEITTRLFKPAASVSPDQIAQLQTKTVKVLNNRKKIPVEEDNAFFDIYPAARIQFFDEIPALAEILQKPDDKSILEELCNRYYTASLKMIHLKAGAVIQHLTHNQQLENIVNAFDPVRNEITIGEDKRLRLEVQYARVRNTSRAILILHCRMRVADKLETYAYTTFVENVQAPRFLYFKSVLTRNEPINVQYVGLDPRNAHDAIRHHFAQVDSDDGTPPRDLTPSPRASPARNNQQPRLKVAPETMGSRLFRQPLYSRQLSRVWSGTV